MVVSYRLPGRQLAVRPVARMSAGRQLAVNWLSDRLPGRQLAVRPAVRPVARMSTGCLTTIF